MKKEILITTFLILLILPFASASLTISKQQVVSSVIPELNKPAVYEISLTNNGVSDNFKMYSLVGVKLTPQTTFSLNSGETKTIEVELIPDKAILDKAGTYNFIYKIEGEVSGIQEDAITIRIVPLKEAFQISAYNLNIDSETATVYVQNMVDIDFTNITATFHSAFFDFTRSFSIASKEKIEFPISLNKEQTKTLVAGSYIATTELKINNVKAKIEDSFKYSEKEFILTQESKSGFIATTWKVEKTNQGNLPAVVQVSTTKNIFSRLFTTFNIEPTKSERSGLVVLYVFQKEIKPGEALIVKVNTNWFYPIILLIGIGLIAWLVYTYTTTSLILRKRATFVKTKGGEFALKITITARAKRFVEKVNVIDRLPPLVKIHEKFPGRAPDRIDAHNGRLEWYIDTLQVGEERVFSYIIFSKVAPLGRFELPTTIGVYEKDGKIHEAASNKAFFLTEPRRQY